VNRSLSDKEGRSLTALFAGGWSAQRGVQKLPGVFEPSSAVSERMKQKERPRSVKIMPPQCQWYECPHKDKRFASIWYCKACGAWGKGKARPPCRCVEIEIKE
jgi:ribosomal protein L37AE/L43A